MRAVGAAASLTKSLSSTPRRMKAVVKVPFGSATTLGLGSHGPGWEAGAGVERSVAGLHRPCRVR